MYTRLCIPLAALAAMCLIVPSEFILPSSPAATKAAATPIVTSGTPALKYYLAPPSFMDKTVSMPQVTTRTLLFTPEDAARDRTFHPIMTPQIQKILKTVPIQRSASPKRSAAPKR